MFSAFARNHEKFPKKKTNWRSSFSVNLKFFASVLDAHVKMLEICRGLVLQRPGDLVLSFGLETWSAPAASCFISVRGYILSLNLSRPNLYCGSLQVAPAVVVIRLSTSASVQNVNEVPSKYVCKGMTSQTISRYSLSVVASCCSLSLTVRIQ